MSSVSDMNSEMDSTPLCVDLDGTLVQSDTLWESIFLMIRCKPLIVFAIPFWILGGKAHFKARVAGETNIDPELLPYNESLLDYLRAQAAAGRPIILATAAHHLVAKRIANHLKIFAEVIASNSMKNSSGKSKRDLLVGRYGENGFDYAANSKVDIPVWQCARQAILVNPDRGVEKSLRQIVPIAATIETRGFKPASLAHAIRVHQWLKNLLVFVPLAASHDLDALRITQAGLAFFAFGFCASSAYLINDLFDLSADRKHSDKRDRPLARGQISIPAALLLSFGLLLSGLSLSFVLPIAFTVLLTGYYLITITYSLFLKRVVLVDVVALAGLYTLRVLAGGAAVTIMPSFWLLAFSMFVFLSLALVKRAAELLENDEPESSRLIGRGYNRHDQETLRTMGVASGYLSVLVVALYINSEDVLRNYAHPRLLWLVCPILLYWVSRLWLKTSRGEMHYDPLVFAIRDRISQIAGLLILTSVILAV